MQIRLQHYVDTFGDSVLNAFDVDAWKRATPLGAFGVGLRVTRGTVQVDLQHVSHAHAHDGHGSDGTTAPGEIVASLVQSGPGSAFSQAFFTHETDGLILPVVVSRTHDAVFEVYFGTDDLPLRPRARTCFATWGKASKTRQRAYEKFRASNWRPVERDAHLLIVDPPEKAGPEQSLDIEQSLDVSTVSAAQMAPAARAALEVEFGRLASENFSYLCFIAPSVRLHPEMFSRVIEMARFLHPGYSAGAGMHPSDKAGRLDGPSGLFGIGPVSNPAWPENWVGEGLALNDLTACLSVPRQPAQAAPGLRLVALSDMRRHGLPNPHLSVGALNDLAAVHARAGMRTVVPLSLAAGCVERKTMSESVARARTRLRESLTTLAGLGHFSGHRELRRRTSALLAARADNTHSALRSALADIIRGPNQITPEHDRPEHDRPVASQRGWNVPLMGARLQERRAHAEIKTMIERIEDLRALEADFASWRLEATDATRWLDRILPGRIVGAAKAQEGIALGVLAAHARMDAMRDEMNGLLHDQGLRASEWQRALGFDDLARSRADLDRANTLALAGLAGKHRGQRAVIVGNGPSLQISDLPLLANDVTFGSNKIFLAFDEVDWRPDYYSVEDALVLQNNMAAISALHGPTKIFPANMRDHGYHGADTIFAPRITPTSWTNPLNDPAFPGFSDDMLDGAHWGSTVVYFQIQLAVYMGFNRIYLVGVDHNYILPKQHLGETYVNEGEHNHFHKAYHAPGELWNQPNLDVLDVSYKKAMQACAKRGVEVYNASRSTRLEAFPRVDFDAVFDNRRPKMKAKIVS